MLTLFAALLLQPPGMELPPLVPPSTPEEVAIHQTVRAQTEAYLNARREGRFDVAWNMLSAARQARRARTDWEAEHRDAAQQSGGFRGQRITGVILADNPPGAPGYFALVEYSADYANVAFMCGMVLWQRQPDGGWRINNETVRAALLADVPNPTPEAIAAGRRYGNCRD